MKRLVYSMFALAIMAFAFSSCEDVPMPYENPSDQSDTTAVYEESGEGTLDSPYNVARAMSLIKSGDYDAESAVYVEGIVVSVNTSDFSTNYGNLTYYISDDGTTTNQLEVYRGYGLGGARFTSADALQAGDKVVVLGKLLNYSGTYEITQGSKIVSLNGEEASAEAEGDGTLASPYNPVAATEAALALSSGETSDTDVYIKGKISSIKYTFSAQYGTATFNISADGTTTNEFTCYSVLYLGNRKWVEGDTQIQVGDEVIICGRLTNYNGTAETASRKAYIYSLNGTSGEAASGSGTLSDPYTPEGATAAALALSNNEVSADDVYIKGKISSIKYTFSASYGTATFNISSDGSTTNEFTCYSVYYLGNRKWVEGDTQIQVGDEVVICGKLTNYNGTAETASRKAYIYSLNSTGGSSSTSDSNTMTADEINSEKSGSVTLSTSSYGSQSTSDESTWYTWIHNNITYKGAKICISSASGYAGEGIQMQGNASDDSKQGFIFNSTAFGSDIKTITIVLSTGASSTYDPGYSVYAGTSAHPTSTQITGSSSKETGTSYNTYTDVFDLSSGSYKYFSIVNDKQGAIYIKSISIELK